MGFPGLKRDVSGSGWEPTGRPGEYRLTDPKGRWRARGSTAVPGTVVIRVRLDPSLQLAAETMVGHHWRGNEPWHEESIRAGLWWEETRRPGRVALDLLWRHVASVDVQAVCQRYDAMLGQIIIMEESEE